MKRIMTSMLLLLTLCVTAFSQNASDFTVDADGVITKYTGFDTVVVIPTVIGGKIIKGIGKEAFLRADLTKVTIPEGVTSIGELAFKENKLTAITIPNSVITIGMEAFAKNRLTSVTISDSVTSIGLWAFGDNRLTSVTIPGSVKKIGNGAFADNIGLAKIVISEGVTVIGEMAFANTKCTSVSLPSTINFIDGWGNKYAFDLSGKPSFTLAANIGALSQDIPAFYSYIANDRKAGTYASNLPLVKKNADDYEYYETRYGAVLTKYTGNSTRVRIPATIGGVPVKALFGSDDYNFIGVFENKKLVAVQIPEGITYIGTSAFSKNELTNVTIPDSVTYLNGFSENQLTSITIPNSVITIGWGAFHSNKKLTSITIPNSVTGIWYYAFRDCESLTNVTIQGTITADNFTADLGSLGNGSWLLSAFEGDLRDKYLAGGIGTYTTTTPVNKNSKWTKK